MIAVGCNRGGGANVDAEVAALLLRAAVGADRRLVVEELRLLELADGQRNFRDGGRLRDRIGAFGRQ
jgi:hypothetical protein